MRSDERNRSILGWLAQISINFLVFSFNVHLTLTDQCYRSLSVDTAIMVPLFNKVVVVVVVVAVVNIDEQFMVVYGRYHYNSITC